MKYRLCFLVLFSCLLATGQTNKTFNNITVEEGLSYSLVFEIIKDKYGFMWFGTTDGLNKYDGYNFTIYQNIPADSTSLPDNSIWGLLEDSSGNIWVGTDGGGLSLFNRERESFVTYSHDEDRANSLIHNSVNSIIEDQSGSLWIGTYGGGISRQISEGVFENFEHDPKDSTTLSSNYVHHIFEDREGQIWAGTKNGLNLFNHESRSFTRITSDKYDLNNDNVLSIAQDETGLFWLATWGGGLNSYDLESNTFKNYMLEIEGGNRVAFVTVDTENTVWAGFLGSGLVSFDGEDELCTITNDQLNASSIINNSVWVLYEDDNRNLWIGTESGISALNLNANPIHTVGMSDFNSSFSSTVITGFSESAEGILFATEQEVGSYNEEGIKKLIQVPDIWSMIKSKDHELWVSSYGYGAFRYGLDNELIEQYLNPINKQMENATYIYEDRNGLIWVGTYGEGLFSYNPLLDQFSHYTLLDSGHHASPPVLNMIDDTHDNLWIGTYGEGLIKLNVEKRSTERIDTQSKNPISHNTILSLHSDNEGFLWIGTDGGGLNRLNTQSGAISLKTTLSGLPSNVILGILEDDNDNLWLSTNAGISKYNKQLENFTNYDQSHGLVSKGFNADAFFEDSDGRFFFGSGNGFNFFHPDSIRPSTYIPPVYFSDLKVLNQSVNISDSILDKHINLVESISLNYEQNFFTLNFAALEYFAAEKITYAYQLEGFSSDWIYTDASNRQATFTNLDHGDYILNVKASNSDGIWGDNIRSLSISILPPPWKTWWAYALYVTILVAIFWVIAHTLNIRERLKSSLRLEQLERKKVEEMDHLKSRFFAGISHEFRTPLTLISSPIDQLIRRFKKNDEIRWSLDLVKRNADRLLRQINQLLDLSKIEAGKLRLQVSKSDIVNWVKITAASFESLAINSDINFLVSLPTEPLVMFYDKNKIEQILINLLSNAFKFTSPGGNIQLKVVVGDDNIAIEVANEGIEIPPEHQDKIFNRYYQIQNSKKAVEGSGIGLALVKEFIELHHGSVAVHRKQSWTVFTLYIPSADSVYLEDDRVSMEDTEVFKAIQQQEEENESLKGKPASKEELPTLLIVEDNLDLRSYMAKELAKEYEVLEAMNGQEGVEMGNSQIPDLIITDLMMPEMDGIEMLQKLRSDPKTNHIPIIMLTAKAEKESRLEGLGQGADHYLNKPFDVDELVVRSKSLLHQRKRIRDHYYNEFLINPKAENIPSMDDRFLEQAVDIFGSQLSNHEFSVDQFAKELAMSRVQLHRKMKAIIGCSASEFMRHYRLKKAFTLLKNKTGSVSQIAYSVGFNNLSYFTKAFKEIYNKNPSQV
ncbi:two-component regulator propeller domain-containing protein [Ekhidna sp.]|uniref:hybrid sensor histidine kinase/response regulator transcription factor n=1 Tax=Ekhidna sp. TaxID=2608089 RepID=UPI00329879D0